MPLIDEVKQVCDRLLRADNGWKILLAKQGLDLDPSLSADQLESKLSEQLSHINRTIKGFEDFAAEGTRGIEPGNPARSLLFHALASPSVTEDGEGNDLSAFPTLGELETVENYVYAAKRASLADLHALADGSPLAIAVFACEYRPGPETPHRKHADICFSRTGVARVGTKSSHYEPKNRGFLPWIEGDKDNVIRVLPARYCVYIAVKLPGDRSQFRPMHFQAGDDDQDFWVPLHKLFHGTECLSAAGSAMDLNLTLSAAHVNEKIRRVHLELKRLTRQDTGWNEPDLSNSPFIFSDKIAEWADDSDWGPGVLMPVVHDSLVEEATYEGSPYQNKLLTYKVPLNYNNTLSSSLYIPSDGGEARHAPEYVHARTKILADGSQEDLNAQANVQQIVSQGGYEALHYLDYSGDGWIEASCPELHSDVPQRVPAYSLVTAPDFFPNTDQGELTEWTSSLPEELQNSIWYVPPNPLSDYRAAPNLN